MEEAPFTCLTCGREFRFELSYTLHVEDHRKKIKTENSKSPKSDDTAIIQEVDVSPPRVELNNVQTNTNKISNLYKSPVKDIVYSSDSDCEYEIVKSASKIANLGSNHGTENTCSVCGKLFLKSESLAKHLAKHPTNDEVEEINSEKSNGLEKQDSKQNESCNLANVRPGYSCPFSFCRSVYFTRLHLDNHLASSHADEILKQGEASQINENRTKTLNKPHKCSMCGRNYATYRHLRIHMRTHASDKPYLCNICGQAFAIKRYLVKHMECSHNEEKRFKCKFCNRGFKVLSNMMGHVRTHTGEKPYKCSKCGKEFTHYSGLTQHLRIHHSGQSKQYVCSLCNKGFWQSGSYKEHMLRHSGERPHGCSVCGKRFSTRGEFKVHMRVHTGERPYECKVCKKSYTRSDGLRLHLKGISSCNVTE